MDRKSSSWWQLHRPSQRRLVQMYSALLHNAYLKGFISGEIYKGQMKTACVPGLNCYSCPGSIGACPLGALQNALSSAGHRAGWYVLGILLLFGVTLGRTICGWLCPLGLFQELLHKIPVPKIRRSRFTRMLSLLKYAVLAVFVLAVPLWYGFRYDLPLPAFCKYICPAGTAEGAVLLLSHPDNASWYSMLGLLFTRKFVILLIIALACIFCYRSFCRFICPLGALYGLFNRFSIVGVHVDSQRCNGCGACVRSCGMDVRRVGDHECIQCGKCMDSCVQGAISVRAGKITLLASQSQSGCEDGSPETSGRSKCRGRVLWGIALALLCFALLWFNVFDPSAGKGGTSDHGYGSNALYGYDIGMQLEDFSLTCYDGTEFRLTDQRGRITFINLWATWCTPCVNELPYFDQLFRNHGDEIAVIAVHSSLVTDDPASYVSGKNYAFPFATDTEDDAVQKAVGGSGTLPQTAVLNRKGEVIYNQVGSVTPEMLEALFEQADR